MRVVEDKYASGRGGVDADYSRFTTLPFTPLEASTIG